MFTSFLRTPSNSYKYSDQHVKYSGVISLKAYLLHRNLEIIYKEIYYKLGNTTHPFPLC